MTVLPSPIPHPLEYRPFDAPGSAFPVLERVVGHDWPTGDEIATWDVADGWFELAGTLAGPQDAAFAAAAQIMPEIDGAGFHDAWQRLAGDASAPLNALVQIAGELGALVEECGREIEAAKLSAWIEIGELLTELTAFSITVALTSGASAAAGEGVVVAARISLLRIFARLVERMGSGGRASTGVSGPASRMEAPSSAETTTRRLFPPSTMADSRLASASDSAAPAVVHGETTRRIPWSGFELGSASFAVHQRALEEALPKDGDGRVPRRADPRSGEWFRLLNAGGAPTDPGRGLNCLDGVLALFETYLHGRPTVAAPRPLGGESDGLRRVEQTTGATFQNLCPFLGAADPAAAKPAFDAAVLNLANHLHNSGHGAFAFILTDLEGGGCHAWAAINQNGTILFLDPLVGHLSEEVPLYGHRGAPSSSNAILMDALVVDGNARPAPLPYHGPGQWSTAS